MKPESLRAWMSAAGGRRFLMCMGAHGVNTALLVLGYMSETTYATLFSLTVGAYLAATGMQKHTEAKINASA